MEERLWYVDVAAKTICPLRYSDTQWDLCVQFGDTGSTREWDRLKALAPRIKTMTLCGSLHPDLASELLRVVPTSGPFLFPRLQSLKIDSERSLALSLAAIVATLPSTPLLKDGVALKSLSERVMVPNTSLTKLSLRGRPIALETSDALVRIIPLCPALRVVELDYFECCNNDLIQSLAGLPDLVDLRLANCPDEPPAREWNRSTPTAFPSLERLDLVGKCASSYASLVASLVNHQRITHLHLYRALFKDCHVVDVEKVVALAAGYAKLESLKLRASGTRAHRSRILRPLHACKHLQVLRISTLQRFELGDGDIEALVSHLPHLRKLTLRSRWKYNTLGELPLTTLRALSIVAAYCPMITEIVLQINTSTGAESYPSAPHKNLRRVHVDNSPLNSDMVQPLVLFFDRLSENERFTLHDWERDLLGRMLRHSFGPSAIIGSAMRQGGTSSS